MKRAMVMEGYSRRLSQFFKTTDVVWQARLGLRVNLTKSVIIPIGEVPNVNALAQFFGCKVDYLPCSLVLKSTRRTEANKVPKRKGQGARREAKAHASWMRGTLLRKIF